MDKAAETIGSVGWTAKLALADGDDDEAAAVADVVKRANEVSSGGEGEKSHSAYDLHATKA
jgi:hypothetical protein